MHGGVGKIVAGKPLPKELIEENLPALEKGAGNMSKNIQIARLFGVPVVVAINTFATDTEREVDLLRKIAEGSGAEAAVKADHWAKGGAGAVELAEAVLSAANKTAQFEFLYPLDMPIKKKIETIATRVYGADGVDFLPAADEKVALYEKLGYGKLPICMAKTHLSLSHIPGWKGVPKGFRIPCATSAPPSAPGSSIPCSATCARCPACPAARRSTTWT